MGIDEDLNFETYKEMNKMLRATQRKLLLVILKNSIREDVIKACKDLKIIKSDYNPATGRLELMEREK